MDQEFSLDTGRVVARENGIQINAYDEEKNQTEYRYFDVDSKDEVLRTKEHSKSGFNTMTYIAKGYWDVTVDGVSTSEDDVNMDSPYKLHVIAKERVIHITTKD